MRPENFPGTDAGSPTSYLVAGQWLSYDVTVTNAGPSDDVGFTLRRPKTSYDAQDYATMEFCLLDGTGDVGPAGAGGG